MAKRRPLNGLIPERPLIMKNYSWKTTTTGLGAIAAALVTLVLNPLMDNDPVTVPNWNAFVPIVITALMGLFARDDDKSSEQVGAGK